MMKLPQATWIETFLEGVTDKSTGLPIFKELAWFTYKVSGVMCSASACDHCWSIEGWIHSKRRNRIHQTLVEKVVRAHTNLVMRTTKYPKSVYNERERDRETHIFFGKINLEKIKK